MIYVSVWWVWIIAAIVLATLEIFVPVQIFIGFAIGAAGVGVLLLAGLGASGPIIALIFALLSLAGWVAVRRMVGVRDGQVKVIDRDINDD